MIITAGGLLFCVDIRGRRDDDSRSRDRSRSRRDYSGYDSCTYVATLSLEASIAPPPAPLPPAAPQQPTPPAAPAAPGASGASGAEGEANAVDDPNNVHKQCEKAAAEAIKRAMALLRKRGLLPPEEVPEEKEEEKKEEVKEEMPAPVNPLLNKIAEKESGNLSWYKS